MKQLVSVHWGVNLPGSGAFGSVVVVYWAASWAGLSVPKWDATVMSVQSFVELAGCDGSAAPRQKRRTILLELPEPSAM